MVGRCFVRNVHRLNRLDECTTYNGVRLINLFNGNAQCRVYLLRLPEPTKDELEIVGVESGEHILDPLVDEAINLRGLKKSGISEFTMDCYASAITDKQRVREVASKV